LPEEEFEATDKQNEELLKFFRRTALDTYLEESESFVKLLQRDAKRFDRFLGEDVKQDLQQIQKRPDKSPDKVIPEDLFRAERYESIGK